MDPFQILNSMQSRMGSTLEGVTANTTGTPARPKPGQYICSVAGVTIDPKQTTKVNNTELATLKVTFEFNTIDFADPQSPEASGGYKAPTRWLGAAIYIILDGTNLPDNYVTRNRINAGRLFGHLKTILGREITAQNYVAALQEAAARIASGNVVCKVRCTERPYEGTDPNTKAKVQRTAFEEFLEESLSTQVSPTA